jgi:hypothetical protein
MPFDPIVILCCNFIASYCADLGRIAELVKCGPEDDRFPNDQQVSKFLSPQLFCIIAYSQRNDTWEPCDTNSSVYSDLTEIRKAKEEALVEVHLVNLWNQQ